MPRFPRALSLGTAFLSQGLRTYDTEQSSCPQMLPKGLPRWHYMGNYGTENLPGGRVCALHGTEMSLLFRERRFREEGKIGAFCCSQISILLLLLAT